MRMIVRRLSVVIALVVCLVGPAVSMLGCATAPPAGTYSAQGTKAYNSVQMLKDLTALSETAKNLNATSGKLHLKDLDTRYVLDFVASAGSAIQSYGQNGSNLAVVSRGFSALVQSLSTDAKQNANLSKALAIVAAFVNTLPQ